MFADLSWPDLRTELDTVDEGLFQFDWARCLFFLFSEPMRNKGGKREKK